MFRWLYDLLQAIDYIVTGKGKGNYLTSLYKT
jgi:hypothetical protein